jgi:shikimate kinase
MEERDPIYALADLTVQSRDVLHDKIVDEIVSALAGQMRLPCAMPAPPAEGDRRS